MNRFDLGKTHAKLVLGLLAVLAVTGAFSLPETYAASHNVLVQVRNNATMVPEKGAQCSFTFMPSGTPMNATANNGGVAKVQAPAGDNSTFVSCTGTDGTTGNATAPLKAFGDTVILVLTS
ncbi:MAG: hypothetical protein KGI33_11580 [Thaumarchaeota archaeon]|nr:hypothetical protein [Nitrososphaerota archaeon]